MIVCGTCFANGEYQNNQATATIAKSKLATRIRYLSCLPRRTDRTFGELEANLAVPRNNERLRQCLPLYYTIIPRKKRYNSYYTGLETTLVTVLPCFVGAITFVILRR